MFANRHRASAVAVKRGRAIGSILEVGGEMMDLRAVSSVPSSYRPSYGIAEFLSADRLARAPSLFRPIASAEHMRRQAILYF